MNDLLILCIVLIVICTWVMFRLIDGREREALKDKLIREQQENIDGLKRLVEQSNELEMLYKQKIKILEGTDEKER